jgi:hypothetical protein
VGEDASLPLMLHGGTVQHSLPVNLLVDSVELAVKQQSLLEYL